MSPPLPQAQRQLEIDIKRLKEKMSELNKAVIRANHSFKGEGQP